MPMLETVIIASDSLFKPKQDYKRVLTHFNIFQEKLFTSQIYAREGYDVFGFIPFAVRFRHSNCIKQILDTFNQNVASIAFLSHDTRAYFINKRVVPSTMKVEDYYSFIKELTKMKLKAFKINDRLFVDATI